MSEFGDDLPSLPHTSYHPPRSASGLPIALGPNGESLELGEDTGLRFVPANSDYIDLTHGPGGWRGEVWEREVGRLRGVVGGEVVERSLKDPHHPLNAFPTPYSIYRSESLSGRRGAVLKQLLALHTSRQVLARLLPPASQEQEEAEREVREMEGRYVYGLYKRGWTGLVVPVPRNARNSNAVYFSLRNLDLELEQFEKEVVQHGGDSWLQSITSLADSLLAREARRAREVDDEGVVVEMKGEEDEQTRLRRFRAVEEAKEAGRTGKGVKGKRKRDSKLGESSDPTPSLLGLSTPPASTSASTLAPSPSQTASTSTPPRKPKATSLLRPTRATIRSNPHAIGLSTHTPLIIPRRRKPEQSEATRGLGYWDLEVPVSQRGREGEGGRFYDVPVGECEVVLPVVPKREIKGKGKERETWEGEVREEGPRFLLGMEILSPPSSNGGLPVLPYPHGSGYSSPEKKRPRIEAHAHPPGRDRLSPPTSTSPELQPPPPEAPRPSVFLKFTIPHPSTSYTPPPTFPVSSSPPSAGYTALDTALSASHTRQRRKQEIASELRGLERRYRSLEAEFRGLEEEDELAREVVGGLREEVGEMGEFWDGD